LYTFKVSLILRFPMFRDHLIDHYWVDNAPPCQSHKYF
jgi:hypothetical protein